MKDSNLICKHISLNIRISAIPYKQIYAFYYSHQDKTPTSFFINSVRAEICRQFENQFPSHFSSWLKTRYLYNLFESLPDILSSSLLPRMEDLSTITYPKEKFNISFYNDFHIGKITLDDFEKLAYERYKRMPAANSPFLIIVLNKLSKIRTSKSDSKSLHSEAQSIIAQARCIERILLARTQ